MSPCRQPPPSPEVAPACPPPLTPTRLHKLPQAADRFGVFPRLSAAEPIEQPTDGKYSENIQKILSNNICVNSSSFAVYRTFGALRCNATSSIRLATLHHHLDVHCISSARSSSSLPARSYGDSDKRRRCLSCRARRPECKRRTGFAADGVLIFDDGGTGRSVFRHEDDRWRITHIVGRRTRCADLAIRRREPPTLPSGRARRRSG
jgi:hypothetical protein